MTQYAVQLFGEKTGLNHGLDSCFVNANTEEEAKEKGVKHLQEVSREYQGILRREDKPIFTVKRI